MKEVIVIGSGYGGLAAAALLQKSGFSVTAFEAHTAAGGCASSYKRKEFIFDVGATTLSGVRDDRPLGMLFKILEIKPEMMKIDPGVIIKTGGNEIYRHAQNEKWIDHAVAVFGSENQRKFWNRIYYTENSAWEFVFKNPAMPPRNFRDLIKLINFANLRNAGLIKELFTPMQSHLEKYGLMNPAFLKFLNEQLLITSQNNIADTPFISAAMGLAYSSETYYPYGGMMRPAELILDKFISLGGEFRKKEKVISLRRKGNYYELLTAKGNSYSTERVVSNIPIWNMAEITEGEIQKYYLGKASHFRKAWGAFVINFAVESGEHLPSPYYQVHLKEKIPCCHGNSMFVSFSMHDDLRRAPAGWKTVTISIHTDTDNWYGLSESEAGKRKDAAVRKLIEEFDKAFEFLKDKPKLFLLPGTPNTFEFYTHRKNGMVGGIPHSIRNSFLRMPGSVTPFENLFMVGDTVFPGQGTPAVVLGAINLAKNLGIL